MTINFNSKISIIVPVYNEAANISKLMTNLNQFKNKCEIIFVDGGSTDKTKSLLAKNYKIVESQEKGRAKQMNFGAGSATGEILFFLHSDSFLESNALEQIHEVIRSGYKVGCFKIKFDSHSLLMKICSFNSNLRVIFRNIAFGDQGIFIKRDFFNELGQFANLPLMEDYQLSIDIKNSGEKIALANSIITTSERRFHKNGRLRTMIKMQGLQHMYRRGVDIEKISRLYK